MANPDFLRTLLNVLDRAEEAIHSKHIEHYDNGTLRVLAALKEAVQEEMKDAD